MPHRSTLSRLLPGTLLASTASNHGEPYGIAW